MIVSSFLELSILCTPITGRITFYHTRTTLAHVKPAPKPDITSLSPFRISPLRTRRSSSAGIVDELVVSVLHNSAKNSLFSTNERVSMIKEVTKDIPNVKVTTFDGLLVDYVREIDASLIIRGLRAVTDFEYELQLTQTNHILNPEVETVFLTTNLQYSYLSSTIVREIASYGGDISQFVPPEFIDRIYAKYNITR